MALPMDRKECRKMDKRIKYRIVLDTETAPMSREEKGVDPYQMWTYDCGWAVVDKHGKIYCTRSFINADIFLDEKEAMTSAYYAKKIPAYWDDIKAGRRILTSWANIRKALFADIAAYNVTEIYAHNARFDLGTVNTTQRWLTKSRSRFFYPYGVTVCDTLKMARDVLGKMPTYRRFCEENGYICKNKQLRYTAEVIYRFITKDNAFNENHTALEDVVIEAQILAYCYKQHKKMRRALYEKSAAKMGA